MTSPFFCCSFCHPNRWSRLCSAAPRTDVYTHGHHASVVSQHAARTAENSAAFLLPSLARGARVLDVGCGPGSITIGLARHVGPRGHVTAIDCAEVVIQQAKAAVQASGLDNIVCETASVYDMPYEAASFDVVYAHQTLQHLRDPVAALVAMCRLVKPGGLIAVRDADYASMRGMPELPLIEEWRRIYCSTCRHNGAEPDAGRHLVRWMRQAGVPMQAIKYTVSVVAYEPSDDEFRRKWGAAWSERCLHSSFAKQAEMKALAGAWQEWAADPESIFQYVNGEVLAKIS